MDVLVPLQLQRAFECSLPTRLQTGRPCLHLPAVLSFARQHFALWQQYDERTWI
jgi:hypothetical protein